MVPNTTQIPNNLFNGEMAKMKDTELRITLLVARKTLGWIEDLETGMRKKEDWISRYQLIKFTGKTGRAISTAVANCIKNGWIEARDKEGKILDTSQKRAGKKIYYRLGKIFLERVKRGEKSSQVEETCEKIAGEKTSPYKRNYITKTFKEGNQVATLRNYFIERCKEMKGFKPEMAFGKEGKLLKDKLKRYSSEQLKDLIDKFMRSKVGEDLGFTLSICLSVGVINQWLAKKLERPKSPTYNGMLIVEKNNKRYCIPNDGGEWLEFAGAEEDIIYK